ncbi:sensor histidine kinase [uncultured Clostridium sp.]|uniref:sensor histidine kinase n=1 Tax=uncultured Clostridium sp. TaxID=59620 RepID=UPI0028EC88CD|nr:sensor histidine kinase [uncultured Clostridium sp.]
MKLQRKIILYITVILFMVMTLTGYLSFKEMKNLIKEERSKEVIKLAQTVATIDVVKDNLGKKNGHAPIQYYVERLRLKTNVQFIVVFDMNGMRYSHPYEENIGKTFVGGDEVLVLSAGESYVSEAVGTLGPSLRGFAPVYKDGVQVGAVSVGILIGNINEEIYQKLSKFIPFLILGLAIGILGASLLAYSIKQSIFGLEPEQIAILLGQKQAMLESIKEGIIAVDTKGNITSYNNAASELLSLNKEDLGKNILNYINDHFILEVLDKKISLKNVENRINSHINIICNYNTLMDYNKEFLGVVINFRDLTEVKELAEELTGIKKILWSLRAQNHEFMNKLHTISGLIQLEEYDTAVEYISEISNKRSEISEILNEDINNSHLQGLLLSKYNKAEEEKVQFIISDKSKLDFLPEELSSDDLSSIVGNLIDNAIESVKIDGSGMVKLNIYNDDKFLNIIVEDNGPGIEENIKEKIFDRGTSTKEGQRGYGMYIVKNIVDRTNGTISYYNCDGAGFIVKIPMKGSRDNDKSNDSRR